MAFNYGKKKVIDQRTPYQKAIDELDIIKFKKGIWNKVLTKIQNIFYSDLEKENLLFYHLMHFIKQEIKVYQNRWFQFDSFFVFIFVKDKVNEMWDKEKRNYKKKEFELILYWFIDKQNLSIKHKDKLRSLVKKELYE